jgi:formylglycine-generating enzyme required for sulfatase activity
MSRDAARELDQFLQRTIPAQEQEYLRSLAQAGSLQVNQRLAGLERDMLCMKQQIGKNCAHIHHQLATSVHHGAATVGLESSPRVPPVPEDDQYIDPSSNILFIRIPGGQLETARASDQRTKTAPPVTIKEFWLAKYPVTQEQWCNVMGKMNPSHFKGKPNAPLENISWKDAMRFIKKLEAKQQKWATSEGNASEKSGNKKPSLGLKRFRLPTVNEWEYASQVNVRNLTSEPDLDQRCWHSLNSRQATHSVGNKLPNDFGLYDMFGNVWEWCDTRCTTQREIKKSHQSNLLRLLSIMHTYLVLPLKSTRYRTLCGGSWSTSLEDMRTRHTICKHVKEKNNSFGFRVAFSCDRKTSD